MVFIGGFLLFCTVFAFITGAGITSVADFFGVLGMGVLGLVFLALSDPESSAKHIKGLAVCVNTSLKNREHREDILKIGKM